MGNRCFQRFCYSLAGIVLTAISISAADSGVYLHSSGGQLALDFTSPGAATPVQAVSSGLLGEQSFAEIGTWKLAPAPIAFDLWSAGDLRLWLGRVAGPGNNDQLGLLFDFKVELLRNGTLLPSSGWVTNGVANIQFLPRKATLLSLRFGNFAHTRFARGDTLSLRVSARISSQSSTPTSPGATVFFDSRERAAGFRVRSFLVPEVSVISTSITEGNAGITDAQVTVRLETAAERVVTVTYATADGSATLANGDYLGTAGTLTFAPGETLKTIHVPVQGDLNNEPDETVMVNLSHADRAILGTSGVLTILNDDPQSGLGVSIASAAVAEGNSGATIVNLAVSLSAPSSQTVSVDFTTADGTATVANNDYLPANGTLTFAPGETAKTISITVKGDTAIEPDETVLVNLGNAVNATIVIGTGIITIINDDLQSVLISIVDAAIAEGNSGTTIANLTVNLSAASSQTVTLDYATADGTATAAGNDYLPANGTLTFAPGETIKTISVTINGDTTIELDETVLVNLSNALNANIAAGTGTLTLQNDDAVAGPPPPVITSPPNLSLFNSAAQTITGTVSDPNSTVDVNGVAATVSGGVFTAAVTLREGNNVITAVAHDSVGNVSTASINLTLDTTAPRVSINSPHDGAILTAAQVTVTGDVNDTVVGTINANQATVDVNGAPAMVANRTYVAMNIALVPGTNVITSTGKDSAGNTGSVSISVIYDNTAAARVQPVSGDGQSAPIGQLLPQPLVVRAVDNTGNPIPGKNVIFKVTQNDGVVSSGANTARSLIVTTDSAGLAQVQFQLGTRAGAGNNQVSAAIVGLLGQVMFCASATPSTPGLLVPDAGNNQVGVVGQPLPSPLVSIVVDAGKNRLPNIPITYTVKSGGGDFGGQPTVTINTDSDGRALASLTLGTAAGNDNNVIEANFPGNTGLPVTFVASGQVPGDPAETSISGVVLDNSDVPVPGATMRIVGNPNAVLSDANGFFQIKPAPVGALRLIADGATVTRPGTWVWLQFNMVTIAGQDNNVGRPVRLLPIDMAHGLQVDATHGGTLTLPQVPGYSLNIAPGSVLFPDGTRSGVVSVTVVHPDKMPDPPSFGQQPRFLVSIQPANAIFNPPAAMCIPNLDGLLPGQKTDMYSYDHDLERFISIGTGTVSEDGMTLCTDPGVGVIKAGWHCGGNPGQAGSSASLSVTVSPTSLTKNVDDTFVVTANGSPPLDGSYSWTVSDPSIVSITAQTPCLNQSSCAAAFRAEAVGQAIITVHFFCTTTGQEVTADAQVVVSCGTPPVSVGVNYLPLISAGTPSGYGVTIPGIPVVDITAYCDANTGVWGCRVTQADEQIKQSVRILGSDTEVTSALVAGTANCTTLTTMATSLNSVASQGASSGYYMVAAVKAHEDVHVADDHAAIDANFPTLQAALESLTVPLANFATATAAKAAIKALPAYLTAETTFQTTIIAAFNVSGSHNPVAPFNAAEHGVVDPMIATIDARKTALGCP